MIKVPAKTTWVLVCDGAKARIFANDGPGTGLALVTGAEHPESRLHTREIGTDQPGRSFDSGGQSRHAMEPPVDWHRFEKTRFAAEMAAVLDRAAEADRFDRLVVAAPPQVLGDLRKALDKHTRDRVAGEIDKDLTHLEPDALAPHLSDWVKA